MNSRPRTSHLTDFSVLLFTMFITGCAVQVGYDLPNSVATSSAQMPADAQTVAAVVEQRLRGEKSGLSATVTFDPAVKSDLTEPGFSYQGFELKKSELIRYNQRPGKTDGRIVAGKLGFEDAVGRRTEVLYYADYYFSNDGIRVSDLRTATLYSTFPEAIMFVLPTSAVTAAGGLPQTHAGILDFVGKHAVNWNDTTGVSKQDENYIIITFLMDRVSPSAEVELKISDSEIGVAGYKNSSKYLDVLGWRIAVAPGRFNLTSSQLYVKAVFQPGDEVGFGGRYKRIVGLFPLDLTLAQKSQAGGS
jgi:hypothetical protein